ncbi:hypothetical protein RSAG8_05427, partial [Rhizoctonia solani AG-8 WAC10335]
MPPDSASKDQMQALVLVPHHHTGAGVKACELFQSDKEPFVESKE